MAIPVTYNLRSITARWPSALVAVLSIAGTVGVFLVVLAMATGFQATLLASGSDLNAIVLRGGADSEMVSSMTLEQVRIIGDAPGVARAEDGMPLASGEVVVVAAFPLKSSGTDANVQARGVSAQALAVRPNVRITEGRFFQPGLTELVVGSNVPETYEGFGLGATVEFGGGTWTIVGIFDAGKSAFDSEIWCDARVLNQIYKRPENIFQATTVHLSSVDAFQEFKDALTSDPRLTVDVHREKEYYQQQSRMVSKMIQILGYLVAFVMAVGAVFAALNTMYSAVSSRSREVATLRALGFGAGSVMTSFFIESLFIAVVGGALGCLAALPFNGFTTGTINWQTFSHLAFAFRVTPTLIVIGIVFSIVMGIIGGLPPAIRAARLPVVVALREL